MSATAGKKSAYFQTRQRPYQEQGKTVNFAFGFPNRETGVRRGVRRVVSRFVQPLDLGSTYLPESIRMEES